MISDLEAFRAVPLQRVQVARLPGAASVFGALGGLGGLRAYRRSRLGFGSCFKDADHIDGELCSEFRDVRGFRVLPGYKTFVHDEAPQLVAEHLIPLLHSLHAPIDNRQRVSA
jgi:hypothetical protein